METTLYKSGQGYWTRLMTALGGGVLTLAGAYWVMDQLQRLLGPDHAYLIYWQGAAAVAVVGLIAPLLFKWVGTKPRTCDFLIATEGEMKKVNWPTKTEVYGATRVVIVVVLIFMGVLYVADFVFAWFFRIIGVIEI